MKSIIIYYPFPLRTLTSGSAVRPVKMIKAFEKLGEEKGIRVININGDSKERKILLQKLYSDIDPKDILFCYMESSTLPFWFTDKDHLPRSPFLEISFFRYLKKNEIKSGIFYRDVYWKFSREFLPISNIRRLILKFFHSLELRLFKKYISYYFLPSYLMNKYICFDKSRVRTLPPAGEKSKYVKEKTEISDNILNLIYVGGISERYGLQEMLQAVDFLNKTGYKVNLHLVCRKKEYKEYENRINIYKDCSWLNIYHAYGNELANIYAQVDIALIPIKKNIYNDFAVPVKLFEYLSYGLPIVATNCEAQAEIINKYNLGIITRDTSNDIAEAIKLYFNKEILLKYKNNVSKALLNNHLWQHRAEYVYNILSKK